VIVDQALLIYLASGCGSGREVVTPLGPTDWKITIDRDAVSVYPSIGNWSLECRSHYWIERSRIRWAE
jgi:hypothetical protein